MVLAQPHREHRSSARVALRGLEVDGPGETWEVESADVSLGGVGFLLPPEAEMSVGDRITVHLLLPDALEALLVRAEVRHVASDESGRQRVGAHFLDADELIAFPVFRYIEESVLAVRATTGGFA